MTEKMTATDAVFVARFLSDWGKADPTDPAAASVARVVEHLHEQIRQLTLQVDHTIDPGITGLTPLDYFAAAALQGLLAAAPQRNAWDGIGADAYRHAKAALQERQRLEVRP